LFDRVSRWSDQLSVAARVCSIETDSYCDYSVEQKQIERKNIAIECMAEYHLGVAANGPCVWNGTIEVPATYLYLPPMIIFTNINVADNIIIFHKTYIHIKT
jgi:hypothetical protein